MRLGRTLPPVESGRRLWCHGSVLGTGEFAHVYYERKSSGPVYDLESAVLIFRLGGPFWTPNHGARPSNFLEVLYYPTGKVPSVRYRGNTHEFIVLGAKPGSGAAETVLPATFGAEVWHLIFSLRWQPGSGEAPGIAEHLLSRAEAYSRSKIPPTASRAKEILEARFPEPFPTEDLAAHIGVSPGHLCRIFKKTYGVTLRGYRSAVRFSRAAALLWGAPIPLGEVATACGFYDQAQFTREMAKFTGQTPKQFRSLAPCLNKENLAEIRSIREQWDTDCG